MRTARRNIAIVMSGVTLTMAVSGCATIINGRSQDVALASTPPGADVKVDGAQTTTPGRVTLKRDQDYKAVFTKEGFPDQSVKLEKKPSWWILGNVLIGGLVGLVIDFVTGGAYKLVPDSVDVDMASGKVKEKVEGKK